MELLDLTFVASSHGSKNYFFISTGQMFSDHANIASFCNSALLFSMVAESKSNEQIASSTRIIIAHVVTCVCCFLYTHLTNRPTWRLQSKHFFVHGYHPTATRAHDFVEETHHSHSNITLSQHIRRPNVSSPTILQARILCKLSIMIMTNDAVIIFAIISIIFLPPRNLRISNCKLFCRYLH